MLKKNTIIVTGGAGFVGSNLIEFLLKKTKYKKISIENYFSGHRKKHLKDNIAKYIKAKTKEKKRAIKHQKKIKKGIHYDKI